MACPDFSAEREKVAAELQDKHGYVLIPPSKVSGKPYERIVTLDGDGHLDWQQVIALLEPALILLMGGIVLMIVLAVLMPLTITSVTL